MRLGAPLFIAMAELCFRLSAMISGEGQGRPGLIRSFDYLSVSCLMRALMACYFIII